MHVCTVPESMPPRNSWRSVFSKARIRTAVRTTECISRVSSGGVGIFTDQESLGVGQQVDDPSLLVRGEDRIERQQEDVVACRLRGGQRRTDSIRVRPLLMGIHD